MKKSILPMIIASTFSVVVHADLLVGTYTAGTSQGVYRYAFDSHTGQIAAQPEQVVKTENPSWLTLSHDQKHLFVVNENGPGQADVIGRVSSFSVAPKTHDITPINQVESKGEEPTHSSLAKGEGYLFVSNYAVHPDPGGRLSVLPINAKGELGEVVQQEQHEASKVNPERQASSHVHSVYVAPNGRDVYLNDLGADRVFLYHFDPKNTQHPLTASTPPEVILAPGSGPRHIVFSKDGMHAYLVTEMAAQVTVFDAQKGGFLKQRQVVDLAAGKAPEAKGGGAIHLSADGKFLYVSNRATSNEMLVYSVAPKSGELKEIQRRSVEGVEPREFTFDPSGKFMLIANQKSNQIVVVRHDAKTGLLGETVQKFDISMPSDVKFLTLK